MTYHIGSIPDEIDETKFRETIEAAFKVWSDVADIEFTETSQRRLRDSIDITFATIDGAGDTLAQAYLPDDVNFGRRAGDIQFDEEENWEFGNRQRSATDIMLVAVHEIGHALGLEHSDELRSVMYPSVSPDTQFTSLHSSDIDSILDLYASRPVFEIRGDFNGDQRLSVADINLLNGKIHANDQDLSFDLSGDGMVNESDRDELVVNLIGTTYGDVNLDGRFDSTDLIVVFTAGRFEQRTDTGGAKWQGGDWNGDGFFDTNDIVLAFDAGGFTFS